MIAVTDWSDDVAVLLMSMKKKLQLTCRWRFYHCKVAQQVFGLGFTT